MAGVLPVSPEWTLVKLEAPPGIEPGMELLQSSALPLGDGAFERKVRSQKSDVRGAERLTLANFYGLVRRRQRSTKRMGVSIAVVDLGSRRLSHANACKGSGDAVPRQKIGAGNGIRTRDFDLGKVALYH